MGERVEICVAARSKTIEMFHLKGYLDTTKFLPPISFGSRDGLCVERRNAQCLGHNFYPCNIIYIIHITICNSPQVLKDQGHLAAKT